MSEQQIRAAIARESDVPEVAHPATHAHVAKPPPGYEPWWDAGLWGMPNIAKELGKGLGACHDMKRKGALKGVITKVGGQWVTTRRKIWHLINGTAE